MLETCYIAFHVLNKNMSEAWKEGAEQKRLTLTTALQGAQGPKKTDAMFPSLKYIFFNLGQESRVKDQNCFQLSQSKVFLW